MHLTNFPIENTPLHNSFGYIEILGVPRMCFFRQAKCVKHFILDFRATILKDNPRLPTIFAFGNKKNGWGIKKGVKMIFNTFNTTWSTVKLNVFLIQFPDNT